MSIISGLIQSRAAKRAAQAQEAAAREALALQQRMFDQTRNDLAPFREQGLRGLGLYADSLGMNGEQGRANALGAFRVGPGYQFALDEGIRARDRSAAARGMVYSGAQLKSLQNFGQGMANQEFGGWQDRLLGLGNMGQGAATQTGQFAQNFANAGGQLIQDAGAARASGIVGSANALANGIGQLSQFAAFALGGGFKPTSSMGRLFGRMGG